MSMVWIMLPATNNPFALIYIQKLMNSMHDDGGFTAWLHNGREFLVYMSVTTQH